MLSAVRSASAECGMRNTELWLEFYRRPLKNGKTAEMRAVQGAGGQPEGVYIEVHNRGLPHRNAEMRSIYVVLLFVFLFAHHYPYRRSREIIGTANGVFEVALIREVQQAFVVDV